LICLGFWCPYSPLRGECRAISGVPVVTTLVCHLTFAREAMGAAGTRHSLRPLISRRKRFLQNPGDQRRGIAEPYPPGCLKIESISAVVPDKRAQRARSGTHNHQCHMLREAVATIPSAIKIGGYGSRRSPGRR
jgi:hypothetical protein